MKGMIKSKKDKGWGRVQIGTSSLVLIFTVLALVIFSTLSLSSAGVDQRLAEKTSQYVTEYYRADSLAEENLRDINRKLEEIKMFAPDEQSYGQEIAFLYRDKMDVAQRTLTYQASLNPEQFILIELEILPLAEARQTHKNYIVRKWMVENSSEPSIDDRLPVWNGEEQ